MLLRIHNLSKSFGGLKAINNLNLKVRQGEIIGLIGPNGSGKTTLFNLISGFLKPDSGRIFFDDQDVTGLDSHNICRLGIARTFQTARPFMRLTATENVMVGRAYGSKPASSLKMARAESQDLLDFTGLRWDQLAMAAALGPYYRKRLEIARALATRPRLLLLDEIMAGLNPAEVEDAMLLVGRIRDWGVTIVMVEHIMQAVLGLSNRIVVLAAGKKIADEHPLAVVHNKQVIECFLGDEKYAHY